MTPTLAKICRDFGITIVVPSQRRYGSWKRRRSARPLAPLQTAAGATLERILREHGPDHLRDVLTILTQSGDFQGLLVAPVLTALSKIMAAHPGWYAGNASKFLEVMDQVDLARLYASAKKDKDRGLLPAYATIAALLVNKLREHFELVEMERVG